MVVAVVRAPLWAALFLGPLMSYCVFLVCAVAGPPTRILKPWAGVWVGGCCGRFFFFVFFRIRAKKYFALGSWKLFLSSVLVPYDWLRWFRGCRLVCWIIVMLLEQLVSNCFCPSFNNSVFQHCTWSCQILGFRWCCANGVACFVVRQWITLLYLVLPSSSCWYFKKSKPRSASLLDTSTGHGIKKKNFYHFCIS